MGLPDRFQQAVGRRLLEQVAVGAVADGLEDHALLVVLVRHLDLVRQRALGLFLAEVFQGVALGFGVEERAVEICLRFELALLLLVSTFRFYGGSVLIW